MNQISHKISIAMCTYNGAKYLQEQLESIARQTCQPHELIICDDGSIDSTTEIIEAFKKDCDFKVKIYRNGKNLGSTKNFEQAILLCEGDIIFLADQDDVWRADKIKKVVALFLKSPNLNLVFTDAIMVDEHLSSLGTTIWESTNFKRRKVKQFIKGNALKILVNQYVVTGATMAFRSYLKDIIVPIHKEWIHDGWIAIFAAATGDVGLINEPLIFYRRHSSQQVGIPVKKSKVRQIMGSENPLKSEYQPFVSNNDHLCLVLKRFIELNKIGKLTDDIILRFKSEMLQVNEKINYMYERSHLPKKKFKRLPIILSNLAANRYHRFSNGFLTAIKDLLHT